MKAFAPNGNAIVGTSDLVPVCAGIPENSFEPAPDGGITHGWTDESEVYWDGQETQRDHRGVALYQDENGVEWPENVVILCGDPDCSGPDRSKYRERAWVRT